MNIQTTTPEIVLFGTLGCHLCDDAFMLVKEGLPSEINIKKVDIINDPKLLESMSKRIPVLMIGTVELEWPFHLADVELAWQRIVSKRRYLY